MPKHSLLRLAAEKVWNRPHLISKEGFQAISSYLHTRNAGLLDFPDNEPKAVQPTFDSNAGIGVITIRGPLSYRTTGWEAACGGFSYEMLTEQASEMIAAGVKTIVIDADSGGGECYGCFESTNELRAMCDAAGVKLYGYIDGHACSAMYAIICACDEVVINPFGEAGSIGVLIALYNDSVALKQEGIERVFITDGASKIPFDAEGDFREEFLADLQTRVTELGDAFREHVSKYTGLSTSVIKDTQAKVYSAKDALALGLVNKIMTRSEFVSYITDLHKGKA